MQTPVITVSIIQASTPGQPGKPDGWKSSVPTIPNKFTFRPAVTRKKCCPLNTWYRSVTFALHCGQITILSISTRPYYNHT